MADNGCVRCGAVFPDEEAPDSNYVGPMFNEVDGQWVCERCTTTQDLDVDSVLQGVASHIESLGTTFARRPALGSYIGQELLDISEFLAELSQRLLADAQIEQVMNGLTNPEEE